MMESDAVFEGVSCGQALHGTYVGGRSELIGSKRASKQLLRPPETCDFQKPDQAYRMASISSSSIHTGEKFCELLSNSGWSVAFNATAAFFGLGNVMIPVEGGRDRAKEVTFYSDVLTSEAFHMQYWYIPKASFNIPRHQMLLSEEALADMRLIHTIAGAETFLSHYNSHVSSGRYHVGGVLLKGKTIKSNSETTLESLLDKISSKANGEGSYEKVKSGVKVVNVDSKNTYSNGNQSSTRKQNFTDGQQASVRCVHIALGPQTEDEVIFQTELNDKSTWRIIDTSDRAELVPVWEIASTESSGGLREACDLLREAWQRSVESSVACRTGRVYELWRQSEQQARTLEVTDLLTKLGISVSSGTSLGCQLSNLWLAASKRLKSDDSVPMSDKLRLFRDRDFQLLLDRIVNSNDDAAKTSLRHIVDPDMQKLLEEQNVVLNPSVSTFIQCDTQNKSITDRLPPLEVPTPEPLDQASPRLAATPALQEDIFPGNIDVVQYNSSSKNHGLYTYGGHFLVDRHVSVSSKDPYKGMMDRMKHRQDPFAAVRNTKDDAEKSDNDDDDFGSDTEGVDSTLNTNCQFKALMQLLRQSDVLVQISLLQILLEERFAVPLVIPCVEDSHDFCHLAEALKFTRVKLTNQKIMEPSIAENTSLPRVVFVSNREVASQRESAEMACEVMNCQYPSMFVKNESGANSAILELGVGFLENAKEKCLGHVPCLAFHVWGDHNKLGTILEKVADIVIIEVDPNMQPSMPSWITSRQCATCFWSINSKGRGRDKDSSHVWGNFKEIRKKLNQYVKHVFNVIKGQESEGKAMTLVNCVSSLAPLNGENATLDIEQLDSIQSDEVRASLKLQNIYTEEAGFFFESLEKRWRSQEFDKKMEECQEKRRSLAEDIYRLPILQLFVHCLEETNLVKRSLSIWHLQLIIDRRSQRMLDEVIRKVKVPSAKTLHNRADSIVSGHEIAKMEYVDKMFGLEHLWRELSHIFVAHPIRHMRLPTLAAHYLLDGFPLEILDGDATYFHKSWVKAVLTRLDSELEALLGHKPKVFVLSVIGLQSSGKSTLLNIMFGLKLKTSAGLCTRGVFLQLVKSEWSEFDYVLILDTMGMRSPEFFGLGHKEKQDNRLAAFAILPADACIIMVTNEDDNGLKEILPMVMLAFKRSALAEENCRKMRAKLFFIYRSVDLNDVHKFAKNQRHLQEELRSAASAITNFNIGEPSESVSVPECDNESFLNSFEINIKDEKQSDVRYFGNHKKGTNPPEDVPDFDYGSKVEELRYYIHDRVLDKGRVLDKDPWKAQELVDWNSFLETVWDSISDSDFELSFLNHIEHSNYQYMQMKLATCRQKVGKTWQDEFELLTRKHEADQKVDDSMSSSTLINILNALVEAKVVDEEKEVSQILSLKHHQKWKIRETERWEADRLEYQRYWKLQLQGFIDGVLKFDHAVKNYMNQIQQEMSDAGSEHHSDIDSDDRKERMKKDFEKIFQRILQTAAQKHKPMAMQVKGNILKIYKKHPVVGSKFGFNDQKSKNENQFFTGLKNVAGAARKNVSRVLGYDAKDHEVEFQTLISKVHLCLEGAKQYSDHIVQEMIQVTLSLSARKSNRVQFLMHKLVKELLEKEFQRIQEQWDSNHNVSKRLEFQREYLWLFFQNLANRVDGTNMLSMAFCCNLLHEKHLMGAYEERITRVVSDKIRNENWLSDGKVMRAHLDLHLIDLIEDQNFEDLLECVSNGAWHYKIVFERFIEKEITKQNEDDVHQNQLKDAIYETVKNAVIEAEHPTPKPQPKLLVFQRSIIKSLSHISGELARLISINVSEEMCEKYGNDIDFGKIRDAVKEKICDISIQISNSNIRKVVHMVRERLNDSRLDAARPRCDAVCPRCNVTCMNAASHSGEHDSLHQPQGLCGVGVVQQSSNRLIQTILDKYEAKKLELAWPSCVKCIELNYFIEEPGKIVSYRDWTKLFPTWALPSEDLGKTVQLREYIFATYQKELLNKYKSLGNDHLEACPDIPREYFGPQLHDFRRELELVTVIG